MTATDQSRSAVSGGELARAVFVFVLFLILAPPLGATFLIVGFLSILHALGQGGIDWPSVRMVPLAELSKSMGLFGLLSYMFGGVQAACVAMVVAVVQFKRPSDFVRFVPMLVATLVVAMAVNVIFIARMGMRPELLMLAVLGAHLGAGIVCWLIANAVLWPFRRRQVLTGTGQ